MMHGHRNLKRCLLNKKIYMHIKINAYELKYEGGYIGRSGGRVEEDRQIKDHSLDSRGSLLAMMNHQNLSLN